ncbi:hypothetical protein [Candidatus Magnetomonas plexicatena]|uniref:hypothetical protein n=1 Tax=Candidatus Magnetomonas plexicatena TaxID=2552947 RepID=UPI001C779D75|nr:hypothetical protein E2O03_005445 [Nitrospirales bacterium LBB_01]
MEGLKKYFKSIYSVSAMIIGGEGLGVLFYKFFKYYTPPCFDITKQEILITSLINIALSLPAIYIYLTKFPKEKYKKMFLKFTIIFIVMFFLYIPFYTFFTFEAGNKDYHEPIGFKLTNYARLVLIDNNKNDNNSIFLFYEAKHIVAEAGYIKEKLWLSYTCEIVNLTLFLWWFINYVSFSILVSSFVKLRQKNTN